MQYEFGSSLVGYNSSSGEAVLLGIIGGHLFSGEPSLQCVDRGVVGAEIVTGQNVVIEPNVSIKTDKELTGDTRTISEFLSLRSVISFLLNPAQILK